MLAYIPKLLSVRVIMTADSDTKYFWKSGGIRFSRLIDIVLLILLSRLDLTLRIGFVHLSEATLKYYTLWYTFGVLYFDICTQTSVEISDISLYCKLTSIFWLLYRRSIVIYVDVKSDSCNIPIG